MCSHAVLFLPECVHMQSTPGELTFTSEGSEDVCGLYLIGMPNQIVEVEFLDFDISCDTGLLAVRKHFI